jgi:hypothetical protein
LAQKCKRRAPWADRDRRRGAFALHIEPADGDAVGRRRKTSNNVDRPLTLLMRLTTDPAALRARTFSRERRRALLRRLGHGGQRGGARLELEARKAGVEAVLGEQRGVRALLHDRARLEDEDAVRVDDGREAMGDD